MNTIFLILQYKALAYIRLNTKLNFTAFLKNIGSGLIYFGFALGSFFFTQKLIHFLLVDIKVGLFLLHEFMSMILFIFFISVNIGNIIVSYSTLYKSSEVIFFFAKPINPSNIFVIKFLDNFFYSSSTMIMIMLSVMIGYAVYFKMSVSGFVFLILFQLVPFILSAGSLGVVILLVVIKLASRYGVRKVIYTLIISYLTAVFLFFKINSPMKLVDLVMQYYPLIDKDSYLSNLIPPVIKYLPNNWVSQSAFQTIFNNTEQIYYFAVMQIISAVLLFSTALLLGKHWYLDTWLKNQIITSNYISTRKNNNHYFSFFNKSSLIPQTESILKKDFLVFMREPSQVIHLSILMFLIIVFVSSVAGIQYFKLGHYYLITIIYLSIYLFILLFISTLSLRFIFPLVSLEGMAFWKLKSAPVKENFYITRKLLPVGFIIFICGQSLSLFANIKLGKELLCISATLTAIISLAIIAINFGMGLMFSNYKEKNPIRLSSSQGASITFLITLCYMLFVVLLLFSPFAHIFYSIRIDEPFKIDLLLKPVIPITVVSILLIYAFLKNGYSYLKKDF